MKLVYSNHVLKRLKKRDIVKKEVEIAIVKAVRRIYLGLGDKGGDKMLCSHKQNGKTITIVYEQIKEKYIIITAYYED